MKRTLFGNDMTYLLAGVAILLALALFTAYAVFRHNGEGNWLATAMERNLRKIQLVGTMKTNLLVSAEAEKSSVMADTDEESRSFAEQSALASTAVEEARRAFEQLLDQKRARGELDSFQQFSGCWEKMRELDREILPLAVQNTNLKAMRLSFGPGGDAIKQMESELDQLSDSSATLPNAQPIARLSSKVLIAVLHIYALQAPHIAERSDPEMDRIEAVMRHYEEEISQALQGLGGLVEKGDRSFLDAAKASYDDFRKINMQVIDLSRQNSNVRSFAISLGQKRKVTAQCMDSLAALENVVRENMTFKATR